MKLLKVYSNEDYVFQDEFGNEYISTPEADWETPAFVCIVISFLIPCLMALTLC